MMRGLLTLLLCLNFALRADEAPQRKVSPGHAYGANTFAGMFTGSLLGAAIGALPYSMERKNQDPNSVILGAVYGAVGGAVALGLPLSAYEVASDKPGAGITVLYDTLGFAVLGGTVGAGAGMISYRRKVDYDPQSAEDFTAAAAAGVCTGALIGLSVGLYEAVWWEGRGQRVPGKGIHASVGVMDLAALHDDGVQVTALNNAQFFKLRF
jgi:hypothetical protein